MSARGTFTSVGLVAVGVVVGFVLGGIAPRAALRDRDQTIASLEEAVAAGAPRSWGSRVPGLDQVLRAPPPDADGAGPGRSGRDRRAEDTVDDGPGTPRRGAEGPTVIGRIDGGVGGTGAARAARGGPGDPGDPGEAAAAGDGDADADREEDPLESFRRAASVQRVRRLQSRAALFEQAHLDEAEQAQVDTVLDDMNTELEGYGDELLNLASQGDLEDARAARDMLGVTRDVTGILYESQVELETILGPERVEQVDPEAIQIWNHVDLERLEPAAAGALGGGGGGDTPPGDANP